MLIIFLCIVTGGLLAVKALRFAERGCCWVHYLLGTLGVLGIIVTLFSSLGYAIAGGYWVSAGYKTAIINREYGTSYTQEEVFYASDVIETIRQLGRQRYEINGDVAGCGKGSE